MHCHILYGVDDGARTKEESLQMLDAAAKGGIRQIMATPHFRGRWNNRELVHRAYDDLVNEASKRGIVLLLGAEFFIREFENDRIRFYREELCLNNSNVILLELSSATTLDEARDVIYPLQRNGMEVIIAHAERNVQIQRSKKAFEEYLIMGCTLQMSIDCLSLPFWNPRRRTALRLLKANAYSQITSDAHCAYDYESFFKLKDKFNLN